jgi:hypothetical protein
MKSFIIACIVLIAGCRTNSNSNSSSNADTSARPAATSMPETVEQNDSIVVNTDTVAPKEETYRLVILFYSPGSGTDYKAINAYEDSIGSYSARLGRNIDYEKTAWGREGETDFCLKLSELNADEQKEFIRMTHEYLKNAKHVNIYENQPCRHKRTK